MAHRALPAAGLTALLALGPILVASPAQAASTGIVALSNFLEFKAASGKSNNLVVSRSGDTFTFDDTVALEAGRGCKAVSGHRTVVTCTVANPGTVIITLGDENDSFVNQTTLPFNVYGGSGNDKLTGGPAKDRLDGGTGNDKLFGGAGNDEMRGRAGNDLVDAGPGDDQVDGHEGDDTLVGREGRDLLNGAEGKDVVWAGAGNDEIWDGIKSSDVFHGGAGRDLLSYWKRTKPIVADLDGRSGDDGESGEKDTIDTDVELLYGGHGDDRLTGNASANVLDGGYGDDKLYGLDGDDVIEGSFGKDTIDGGDGADLIRGSYDADSLRGGAGADVLIGGDDRDTIDGDAGDDELYGWLVPHNPDDGPGPMDPDFDDDKLGGALDGGDGDDLCMAGTAGSQTNCER